MSDEDKNAARTAISHAEEFNEPVEWAVYWAMIAIAKTLWLIAMILVKMNEKLKK